MTADRGIFVSTVAIHEAGHAMAAILAGVRIAWVWAFPSLGIGVCAAGDGMGDFAGLCYIAAGIAAETEVGSFPLPARIPDFWAEQGAANLSPDEAAKCLISPSSNPDRDRFDDSLESLAAKGRIARRPAWQSRWWWRCRRQMERMARAHRPEIRAIAAALDSNGALLGSHVAVLLKLDSPTVATMPQRLAACLRSPSIQNPPEVSGSGEGADGQARPAPSPSPRKPRKLKGGIE